MADRMIAVFHGRNSTAGKVGERLAARGFEVDARRPCHGDTLPGDLSGYAAAIVFGGPQSANDDHDPGIRAELNWLEGVALPSGVPLLGICLGAQQIARVLGARVGPHPDGLVEIGYYEVRPTGRCPRFLAAPTMFYQWHRETFEIPRDAVHLAENALFPGQAFRYREHVYGIEFHPEMTREMIESWCGPDDGSARLDRPNAQGRETQLEGYACHAGASERWLDGFLDQLLGSPGNRGSRPGPAGGRRRGDAGEGAGLSAKAGEDAGPSAKTGESADPSAKTGWRHSTPTPNTWSTNA